MSSLTNPSFLTRWPIRQIARRLLPVLILYFLLSSDRALLGLIERYGQVGRYMLYQQLVLQSSIF